MLYNTDGCHGKFLKYQIQVKNEIVLIPPISGSLCAGAYADKSGYKHINQAVATASRQGKPHPLSVSNGHVVLHSRQTHHKH